MIFPLQCVYSLLALLLLGSGGAENNRIKPSYVHENFPDEAQIEADGHFRGIRPTSYSLKFKVKGPVQPGGDLQFEGTTVMAFTASRPNLTRIHVHAVNLSLRNIALGDAAETKTWGPISVESSDLDYVWSVKLPFQLENGEQYRVALRYTGWIRNETRAIFYHHTAGNGTSSDSWVISTVFQMRHAREAFPCVDHPLLKATFNMCVEYEQNEPLDGIEIAGGTKILSSVENAGTNQDENRKVCFHETPIIPTNVVAFAILKNFVKQTSQSQAGMIPVTVYHLRSDSYGAGYASIIIDETGPMIQSMEEYFETDFPLKQVSFILHPSRSDSGFVGIENMGLIGIASWIPGTFKQKTFAHELVHHWIGNAVTLTSWNDMCVQEGLTSAMDVVFSQLLGVEESDLFANAFKAAYSSPTADEGLDGRLKEMTTIEDVISQCYTRPVAVFVTLQGLGGPDKFRDFVVELIRKHKGFNNWKYEELERIVESKISESASKFLHVMFHERTYPVLLVKLDNATNTLNVTGQWRFYGEPPYPANLEFPELPIHVASSLNDWQTKSLSVPFTIDLPPGFDYVSDWIMLRTGNYMYRVLYDLELYGRFLKPCNRTTGEKCIDFVDFMSADLDLQWAQRHCFLPWFCEDSAKRTIQAFQNRFYELYRVVLPSYAAKRLAVAVGVPDISWFDSETGRRLQDN